MENDEKLEYRALPFMRWEVAPQSQELVAVRTQVGMNVMAIMGRILAEGGTVQARTFMTDNGHMPHDGRLVMLLDAHMTRVKPAPLDAIPLGEIPL